MLILADILKPHHVDLALQAPDAIGAVERLSRLLQGDARISSWTGFHEVLLRRAGAGLTALSCGAAIAHARTDQVETMFMAAGRRIAKEAVAPGNEAAASGIEADGSAVKFLFVIGLPPTMASDYLRIVGALARSLKQPSILDALEMTSDAEEFVETLSRQELAI